MVGELRVKAQIRDTFGKYVDPRIVAGLIDRPELTDAKGGRREMTILFCDMKGFTAFSEGMTPSGLVNVLNRYMTVMSEPVRHNNGIIDKYIGDGSWPFGEHPSPAAKSISGSPVWRHSISSQASGGEVSRPVRGLGIYSKLPLDAQYAATPFSFDPRLQQESQFGCSVGVGGLRRHQECQNEVAADLRQMRPSVDQISRIGMDTSKHIFQLQRMNTAEEPVLRKKLRRKEMFALLESLAPTVIAIEACGASHHCARLLQSFGH
jgi:class 3 adenylate cyclase